MITILSTAALFTFAWGVCSCWSNYEKLTAIICIILAGLAFFALPVYFNIKLGFPIVLGILSGVMLVKSGDAFDSL